MQIQVCFVEGMHGAWLDYEPAFPLPTEHPDEIPGVVEKVAVSLPEGMTGIRVLTSKEVWTFTIHPTWGLVPYLEVEAGEVVEHWPTNAELGGQWWTNHVLPDGSLLPLCYVEPSSTFLMGDPGSSNGKRVNVPGGFMALTPTTVRQWNRYAKATGKTLKVTHLSTDMGVVDLNDHPVTGVSYWDACEFTSWAGLGIPTEEQWEHAARGGDGRKFPWGNESPTDELCHSSVTSQKSMTDDVFSHPRGASPYGCLDMVGNVWEWTSTAHK